MINNTEKLFYLGIFLLVVIIGYNFNSCIEKFIETNVTVPKNIYIFNDKSLLTKVNIEAIKLNTPLDWNIIVLTKNNISDYIEKSNLDIYNSFSGKRFIDLVTLDILYNNGGIVIDPFIQIYSGEIFNNFVTELYYQEYDCTLIEFNPITKKNQDKYNSFIKSWIYLAPINSAFIKSLQTNLYENYSLDFNDFIKKEKIIDNKISLIPSYNESFFIHYKVINKLLKNGFLYNTSSKIEKSKKVYSIRKSKTNVRNDSDNNIQNYIFKLNI